LDRHRGDSHLPTPLSCVQSVFYTIVSNSMGCFRGMAAESAPFYTMFCLILLSIIAVFHLDELLMTHNHMVVGCGPFVIPA
jgi:hypothetical protein